MGNLLFSPSGRIGPSAFMKGMLVLAAISGLITLSGLVSFQISQILGLISLLLIIPLFFLLIKRSHDAGRSGWMSIVWFIVWLIILVVISMVMGMVTPSGAQDELKEAMEAAASGGAGLGEIMEITKEMGPAIARQTAIPSAIAGLIGTGIAAFLINTFNKSNDHDNQFGPATTGDS